MNNDTPSTTESIAAIVTAVAAAFPPTSAVAAFLAISESLLPVITRQVQTGAVTPEQQAEVRARYDALVAAAAGQFSGPEWRPSGDKQ